MFNPFTMFFAVPRGDDLETLASRARARYDAMSPADKRAHDEAQRASFVRGNLGVDNPEAADRFEKRRLETVLDNMSESLGHPSDWPRPARTAPPSTINCYPLVMAEKALSNLIGLPITQEMRDRFYADVAKGQSAYDDAGTTYERHYRAMLGLPVEEPVTHREFVRTVVRGDFPVADAVSGLGLTHLLTVDRAKTDLLAAALAYIENVGDYDGRYATLRSAAKGYRDAERKLAGEGKE